jgi:hypothetical protein
LSINLDWGRSNILEADQNGPCHHTFYVRGLTEGRLRQIL